MRAAALAAALAAGGAAPAAAQGPQVRAELAAWRDSLLDLSDSAAAASLERRAAARAAAVTAAQHDRAAAARLRHALATLRHGELGNQHRLARAERLFRDADDPDRRWPWPPYGRALARAAEFEAQRGDSLEIGKRVGVGRLADAVRHHAEAVARDPGFTPSLVELERLAWQLHEPAHWTIALAALRTAAGAARRDTAVLRALARLEREVGNADSALSAIAAYRAAGGGAAAAHLETARIRLQRGYDGGAAEYYAGAAIDDSLAVAEYRADVALVVADSALAEFDAARGAERAAVLRRFWHDRARRDLREPDERLREHYRRLQYARRHFALSITRRHQQLDCAYRSGSTEFDDRGIIYLRHGAPTTRLRVPLSGMMPNETWRYRRADGDLLFHFGAGMDIYDYRLTASVADLYGRCSRMPARYAPPMSEVWLSREHLDPMYAKLSAWSGTDAGQRLARKEREIGAASIAVGTSTESYDLRFGAPLRTTVQVVAVGSRGPAVLGHVIFAIAGPVQGEASPEGWRYPVRVRAVAEGSDGTIGGWLDTTVVYAAPAGVDSVRHLVGRVELPLPPGQWQVRAAVAVGEAGRVSPRAEVAIEPAGAMRLSDLAVGMREVDVAWRAPSGELVYFTPYRTFAQGAELELYYELDGLVPGSSYSTRLEIESRRGGGLFRRRPPGVRLGFQDVATSATSAARRSVRLDGLEPGEYWLDVEVSGPGGARVSRRVAFDVRPPPSVPTRSASAPSSPRGS